MKQYYNLRKNAGISTFDMLIALGVIMLMMPFLIQQTNLYQDKNIAIQYADQTKTYAKAFNRAIANNYSIYYDIASKTSNLTQVLKASQLLTAGYLPNGMGTTNIYHQTPCVTMHLNTTTNQIEAIMFYVQSTAKPNLDLLQAKRSAMATGGEAGSVQADGSVQGAGWSLPKSSPFLTAASTCDFGTLAPNSVVMNLSMLPDYTNNLKTDPTLHRNQDNLSGTQGGDPNNLNTMQSDITMQTTDSNGQTNTSGIFLSGNVNSTNPVLLAAGGSNSLKVINPIDSYSSYPNQVVIQNGAVKANTLQPTTTVSQFTPCSLATDPLRPDAARDEVGAEVTDASGINFQRMQLICTYNPTYCTGSPSKSCYLPTTSVTIQFTPNTTSFDCTQSAGPGYYIVSGSIQMTGNSIDPLGSEDNGCHQQYDAIINNATKNSVNQMDVSISPTQYVQNVGAKDWQRGSCSWHLTRTFTINQIQCTNDTSTFVQSN